MLDNLIDSAKDLANNPTAYNRLDHQKFIQNFLHLIIYADAITLPRAEAEFLDAISLQDSDTFTKSMWFFSDYFSYHPRPLLIEILQKIIENNQRNISDAGDAFYVAIVRICRNANTDDVTSGLFQKLFKIWCPSPDIPDLPPLVDLPEVTTKIVSEVGAYGLIEQDPNDSNRVIKRFCDKPNNDDFRNYIFEIFALTLLQKEACVPQIHNFSVSDLAFGMEAAACSLKDLWVLNDLPLKLQIDILLQILKAVRTLHRYGLIHRDLKGANVLFFINHTVTICDFGASTTLDKPCTSKDQVTTESYAGPELCAVHATIPNIEDTYRTKIGLPPKNTPGSAKTPTYSKKTDVYAIFMIAYEMLDRNFPFAHTRYVLNTIANLIINVSPGPCTKKDFLDAVNNNADYTDLVFQAYSLNPADRPTTDDAIERLEKIYLAL